MLSICELSSFLLSLSDVFISSAFVVFIVYTFLLPFSAVTVIVVVLRPMSILVPVTLTVALESFATALTVSF